jgi:ABC-type phosphate/phosphonate transport system substrate-binding protein
MTLLIAALLHLLLSDVTLAQDQKMPSDSERVTVKVIYDDGGKTTKRHMHDLLDALNEEGCRAILADASAVTPIQLFFDSKPAFVVKKQRYDYRLIARAKTLYGEIDVRGAIVIHASRGISDLSLLKGEWIAFVSKNSWSGYHLPLKLLQEAGVNEDSN